MNLGSWDPWLSCGDDVAPWAAPSEWIHRGCAFPDGPGHTEIAAAAVTGNSADAATVGGEKESESTAVVSASDKGGDARADGEGIGELDLTVCKGARTGRNEEGTAAEE